MLPTQVEYVSNSREAYAPYNFVPLPEQVVLAESQESIDQSVYHPDRHTGRIVCTLTTASPLYVRCGYAPEDYAELGDKAFYELNEEQKHRRAQFFNHGDPSTPVIPGSSLRGMLRALVEIASYGKMERVTDVPRFFFRAVAAKSDDPLAKPYRDLFKDVRAGYLERCANGWYIRPAELKELGRETFIKLRETDVPPGLGLVRMNDPNYHLQYIPVSFEHKTVYNKERKTSRPVIDHLDKPDHLRHNGWLVTSGNMLETGKPGARTNRKNHVVVLPAGNRELKIADNAVRDYRAGLSDFLIDELGEAGVLQHGRPVFYCEPKAGAEVIFFGHCANFRLPYWRPDLQRAATPADFVPGDLKDEAVIDLAEAIFGTVRRSKQARGKTQAIAGRVFVDDAYLEPGQVNVLYDVPITPQILAGPKPTTFQHYLVQEQADLIQVGTNRRGDPIKELPLAHYGSQTPEETVVRGHKLYWHKGQHPEIELPASQNDINESQKTNIRPVKPNTRFTFNLRFENLSDVELGALLWVLEKAADDSYRLKLGMGKPLGMGAVKIEHDLIVSQLTTRYTALFADDAWATGETSGSSLTEKCLDAFHSHVLSALDLPDCQRIDGTLRIQCLLALLKWPGPAHEATRYMEIERAQLPRLGSDRNEYKDRRVLPLPRQVGDWAIPACDQAVTLRRRQGKQRRAVSASQSGAPAQLGVQPTFASPQLPTVGTVFTGLVLQRDNELVVIAVPEFIEEQAVAILKVEEDTPRWKVGKDKARVEVVSQRTKGDLAILNVRRAAKADKK